MTHASTVLERLLGGSHQMLTLLGDGPARTRTEQAVRAFARGVACAREHTEIESLASALTREPELAWEGVGLVTALDGRFEQLLTAQRERATWLYIGLGFADALLGRGPVVPDHDADAREHMRLDGHGFWLGLRHGARLAEARHRPELESAAELFDQGVGRSLYFVHGGTADGIARAIAARGQPRATALWLGVGIAAHVTGGLGPREPGELDALLAFGGEPVQRGLSLGAALSGERGAP
jgi:hypothetical protein